MGFTTLIAIDNDRLDEILGDPERFARIVKSHASGGRRTALAAGLKLFSPQNRQGSQLYVLWGGEVLEISLYSEDANRLRTVNPESARGLADYLEEQAEGFRGV